MSHIKPEARTIRVGDGEVGVVVSHGFTGCTHSVAGWAAALADSGLRVVAPRLSGHGTSWQDLDASNWQEWYSDVAAAYYELALDCRQVFVAGLSMGGALALRLAEMHDVAGVLLVNPAIASRDTKLKLARWLHWLVPATPGVTSDIKKPGVEELGYRHTSVRAAGEMTQLWSLVRRDLHRISAPTLLFKSTEDHVVDGLSREILTAMLPQLQTVELHNSYHVATMDNDAELINTESIRFIRTQLGAVSN